MQGHCHKNCNYDYLKRLAFRNVFTAFYSNLKRKGFVLGHNLHEENFSQLSSILIEEFCSCYSESHLSLTCPRTSQNTKQYHSWTTNEKLWMICDLLAPRPISHITQKTLSLLHSTKIEQITKTMAIFYNKRHFSLLHSLRCNTTTNFRPAARAYSQRYHLLLQWSTMT